MTAPAPWRSKPGIRVTLGGTVLAAAGTTAAQVLVDEAVVAWGTDDPLTQPEPATGSLALLDQSLVWAARQDLLGTVVTFEWLPDAALTAAGVTAGRVYFRGRVTGVAIHRPEQFTGPDTRPLTASLVELELTSVEVDLANRFVTDGSAWPAETLTARAARIATLAGATVTVRTATWGSLPAAAVPAGELAGTSARDLLLQLYNSTGGDRMIYSPHTQSYEWLGRRQLDARTLGMAAHLPYGRAGEGAVAVPRWRTAATGVTPAAPHPDRQDGTYLDGHYLTTGDALAKSTGQKVTRSQVTWRDPTAADASRTSVVVAPAVDETVIGRRAITLDSLHNDGNAGLTNAQDLLAMATQEGAAWRPPVLRWDTEDTDGFLDPAQVTLSLRGHSTAWLVFVQRSWFTPLGVRPVFSAIGGRIAYAAGRWVIDYRLGGWASSGGGIASPTRVLQHMVTWEELDNAATPLVWTDGPAANGVHESLTYEDLGFVGLGMTGTGNEGPDTGWDEYHS